MEISTQEIRRLARLMRLNLTDEEVCAYTNDIVSLEKLATALLPFSESVSEETFTTRLCELREDEDGLSLSHTDFFANVSKRNGAFLTVPRVIGEGDA